MRYIAAFFLFFLVSVHSNAQCSREAFFQDGPDYELAGSAILEFDIQGGKYLRFSSDFDTAAGPDLHVYLSNSEIISTPSGVLETASTIDIGLLKSNTGAQTYDLSSLSPALDLESYAYVIIHCSDYNHYWGAGEFGNFTGSDCESLSVENITENSVEIFPSIVENGSVSVRGIKGELGMLKIVDISGRLQGKSVLLNGEFNRVDTSFLREGIYLFQLQFNTQTRTQKIIIK